MTDSLESKVNDETPRIGAKVESVHSDVKKSKTPGCLAYLAGFTASASAFIYAYKEISSNNTAYYGLLALGFIGVAAMTALGVNHYDEERGVHDVCD